MTAASVLSAAVGAAAGKLLPAQAWNVYPEHKPDAHKATETDLYTSKGAEDQQQENFAAAPRCVCTHIFSLCRIYVL